MLLPLSAFERLPLSLQDAIVEFLPTVSAAQTKVLNKNCKPLSCPFHALLSRDALPWIKHHVRHGGFLSSLTVGANTYSHEVACLTKKLRELDLLKLESILDIKQDIASLQKLKTTQTSDSASLWMQVSARFANLKEVSVCTISSTTQVDLRSLPKLTKLTVKDFGQNRVSSVDVCFSASVQELWIESGMTLGNADTSWVQTLVISECFFADNQQPNLLLSPSHWPALADLRIKGRTSSDITSWLNVGVFRLKTFEFESYAEAPAPENWFDFRDSQDLEILRLRLWNGQQLPPLPGLLQSLDVQTWDRETRSALQRALQAEVLAHLSHLAHLTLSTGNDNDTIYLDMDKMLRFCHNLRRLCLNNVRVAWRKIVFPSLERIEFDGVRGVNWATFQCFHDSNVKAFHLAQPRGWAKIIAPRLRNFTRLEWVDFSAYYARGTQLVFNHDSLSALVPPTCVVCC